MNKKEKIEKVVSGYDEINFIEAEIKTLQDKLEELLNKEKEHEFILFDMLFIDNSETITDEDDENKGKSRATPDNFNEIFIEIRTKEAIQLLNIMLNTRLQEIKEIEDNLDTYIK